MVRQLSRQMCCMQKRCWKRMEVWKSGTNFWLGDGFKMFFFNFQTCTVLREMIQFDYAFCFSNWSKSVHILERFWVAVGRRNTRIGEKIAPLSEDSVTICISWTSLNRIAGNKPPFQPPFWAYVFWRYFWLYAFWDALRCVRRTTWSIKHSWSMPCAWGSWWCFILVVGSVNAPPQCCPIRAVPLACHNGTGVGVNKNNDVHHRIDIRWWDIDPSMTKLW